MKVVTEFHDDLSCEIEASKTEDVYHGIIKYSEFEVGQISGRDLGAVSAQFKIICVLVDAGGMVRHGIIMLGYHNGAFEGDVLLVDGEIIGEWTSDDEEWCHFTATDAAMVSCSAPSPWLLHDSIATWMRETSGEKDPA
ncbi:hypothetical protein A8B82_19920 [Sulfitobacter sp. EhC04]|uniref:hypothetical protein n=1 Tax=Sulfitobacter sp. EhC04 TaxID=1849168 RepID=UPI0007F3490C|nr:hypothetical protein [Sulfitobacter sp. EhC04]OAN72694.1 hypothetical protein A8B82_19920 [Sulfitobacter sp. EhC04]|tara:strand:- start:944 stop:1360 length:417 start_codon:yes stop_codon:yes gene_type:complete